MKTKITKNLTKNRGNKLLRLPAKWLTLMFNGEEPESVKMEYKKGKIIVSKGSMKASKIIRDVDGRVVVKCNIEYHDEIARSEDERI